MSDEELLSGKTVNNHWARPHVMRTNVNFILHQNQVWVNRQNLLKYLEKEIEIIKHNHVPDINNYWDHTKVEYLRNLQRLLRSLLPEEPQR